MEELTSKEELLEEFKSRLQKSEQKGLVESYIKRFSLEDLERQFDLQIRGELDET
jgi:hypothetical protein